MQSDSESTAADSGQNHDHEELSLPLFAFTVLVTLGGLGALLWLAAPSVWDLQWLAPAWKFFAAFALISLVNCFMEFFFHRYVLHLPAIPFLSRLYRQHTLHHALTRITRRPARDGRGILFIENKFPIIEPEQGEASFFPWYSLTVFALLLTPLFALLQWLAPSFPWFFGGYAAIASSLVLYEVLHAINHWPFETWAPLITHRRWGWFWQPVYAFHLRHHAVTDCNESVSGWFGLPVADWVFGTCVIPQTVYAEGEEATPEKFASPQPCRPIRALDVWAQAAIQHRRDVAADGVPTESADLRVYTRGEEIAHWVTHGIGLAVSVAALTLLIVFSSLRGSAWEVVSFTIFGLTLLGLSTVAVLRQAFRSGRAKELFRRLDQPAIFVFIAGTYTPFLFSNLRGGTGWLFVGAIWGLCGAAAVYSLVFGARHRLVTIVAGLFVSWTILVAMGGVIATLPPAALWLLVAGAACYGVGAIFYFWQRLRFHRATWHALVLGGSTCHLLTAILFLLPVTR